jgi:prepilin-type N-terminal cleavage/methylation domain-containing protein/prepilin-type processing-associated H-X9-DG protein
VAFVVLISLKRMNPNASNRRTMAFTLVEMLVVIAIIGILAALLLPVLNRSEVRTKRVVCINVQQQIGLAFHVFSNDHNGKFPMAISTNDNGSLEFVQSGYESGPVFYTAYRHFQTLSNELVRPQMLICPAEMSRFAATNFGALQNENLSYFVGVQSTFDKPNTILAGDRNLVTNSYDQPTILQFGQWSRLGWTWELHQFKGNVLYADGHVDQWNDSSLAAEGGASPYNQSFFLPTIVPSEFPLANDSPGSGPSGPSGSGPSGSGGPDSGSTGPGPSDSGGSGSPPSNPSGPDSGQSAGSESGASRMNGGSSSPGGDSSSSGQPAPWVPAAFSQSVYTTETVSQAQADYPLIARTVPPASDTDAVVSVQDTNTAMSPFDQHMTIVLRHSLGWLYLLLLLILLLLYLANRLRKRLQEGRVRRHFRSRYSGR